MRCDRVLGLSGFCRPILGVAMALSWLGMAGVDARGDESSVAYVEEDWELVVDQPATSNNGPQITCSISPLTMDAAYAALDINYHTQSDYVSGGLQMHAWNPSQPIVTATFPASGMLNTSDETITWTQTMALRDGLLRFQVVNGQSQTWGAFGGPGQAITLTARLENLNGYDPQVSLDNSGVSFASNRVRSLTLQAVRWFDGAGRLVRQVTTPQVAFPRP